MLRILIDGYNLMYAVGALGERRGPDAFRRKRTRFLNDLAARLGADRAAETTIVFDAASAPEHLPQEQFHNGLSVVYAIGHDSADACIERIISAHSTPKQLTVVSTDHRIRLAAKRRRAAALTADEFWSRLDDDLKLVQRRLAAPIADNLPERPEFSTPEETRRWLAAFADVEQDPEVLAELKKTRPILTDDEIRQIEREVELED